MSTLPHRLGNIAVAVSLLTLAGCSAIKRDHQMYMLERTLYAYENAIRWGDFAKASDLLMDGARADSAALAHLKVTSYEVLDRSVAPDKTWAEQKVRIRYYHDEILTERSLVDRQRWQYLPEQKVWKLDGSLPAFAY